MSKKKISGEDLGIIFSIIGIIASILVIILNTVHGENRSIGIVLLLTSTSTLSMNVRNKKNK